MRVNQVVNASGGSRASGGLHHALCNIALQQQLRLDPERGVTAACPVPTARGVAMGKPERRVPPATMHTIAAKRHLAAPSAARDAIAWMLPLSSWSEHARELERLVPEPEQRRFAAIRNPAKRRDRLLAAALHRMVLAQALELPVDAVPLYRGDRGQPRLALPGLHTSLAHAEGMVAVAFSEHGPVGVDVEMLDVPSLRPIVDLVCAPGEASATRDADLDAWLLGLWVRKEALLKAAGIGLARPMASFRAPEGGRVLLRDAQGSPIELVAHSYTQGRDCLAAIATVPGARPRWIRHIP
jgi:4'-phosphopantetheinyl transferase